MRIIMNYILKTNDILDNIKHLNGRNYVELFSKCPMCIDCPDGCPIDK